MRVVILGCGRVGAQLAKNLDAEGHQVTVIDLNQDAFRRLGAEFRGAMVLGTGIDEDILKRAGIEKAQAFVAVTNGDNTNIMASQIARHIFKVPHVVARIYDPVRADIYRNLGLDVLCPTKIGAQFIRDCIIRVWSP
jgi:trk system potassium uptake protein TrkA